MVAADFDAYAATQRAHRRRLADQRAWRTSAIRNIANVGWFSSDRTIREYAREIWGVLVKPSKSAIAALLAGTHADPFSLLGIHQGPKGAFARAHPSWRVQTLLPRTLPANDARQARSEPMTRGLFEGSVTGERDSRSAIAASLASTNGG